MKLKNITRSPRGVVDKNGRTVVLQPGEIKSVALTSGAGTWGFEVVEQNPEPEAPKAPPVALTAGALDALKKAELLQYLTANGVEFDEEALKPDLLVLAKAHLAGSAPQ